MTLPRLSLILSFMLSVFLSCSAGSCSRSHRVAFNGSESHGGEEMAEQSPSFIVEGYLEFPGPNERWAGPQSVVIHLSTLDPQGLHPRKTQLTIEEVREDLSRLKGALEEPKEFEAGCLFPLRVRLIQADGILFEKQACRGQKGWPRIASEIASEVIDDRVGAPQPAGKH